MEFFDPVLHRAIAGDNFHQLVSNRHFDEDLLQSVWDERTKYLLTFPVILIFLTEFY
jgi:hypothetical protein